MARWKADLLTLPTGLGRLPTTLAPVVRGQVQAAIAGGRAIDGSSHAPVLEPGRARSVPELQDGVTVFSRARSVVIRMVGGMVYREYGTGQQRARPVLGWDRGIPPKLGNAIRLGIVSMGTAWMTRHGSHVGPTSVAPVAVSTTGSGK